MSEKELQNKIRKAINAVACAKAEAEQNKDVQRDGLKAKAVIEHEGVTLHLEIKVDKLAVNRVIQRWSSEEA